MPWPLSQDYNEAIQSPAANFSDADLRRGEAAANRMGLPMPCSGNFADVYQMRCPDGSRWAVKCFTRETPGLRERYQKISAHLNHVKLPFMVDFSYLKKGIRVAGAWYPVLKMQWVEGLTLNQFVGQNLDNPALLETLVQRWTKMGQYLREAQVGHCDLQHGNVLLTPGSTPGALALKLIDYDGMWIPPLATVQSGELGHANYQHPQRMRSRAYNLEVDRFPLLLVATALHALKSGGAALWRKYDNADNLLFKEIDLREPVKSPLFYELTKTNDPVVRPLLHHVLNALRGGIQATPLLDEVTPTTQSAPLSSSRLSCLTTAAPPVAASFLPVTPVVSVTAPVAAAGAWNFEKSASATTRPKYRRGWQSTAFAKAIRIAAVAATVLLILGLVGAAIVLTMRDKSQASEGDAILVVRINQPGAVISVDGRKRSMEVPGNHAPVEIKLRSGKHKLDVSKMGFLVVAKEVELQSGTSTVVNIDLELLWDAFGIRAGVERADNGLKMKLCWCPPGSFKMGSPPDERGHLLDEEQVEVTLTKGFWLGKYAVTQWEWEKLMGMNPSDFRNGGPGANSVRGLDTSRFPVEEASWDAATEYCRKWTELEHEAERLPADWEYRLPTEAQREYACRAGSKTATAFGEQLSSRQANFNGNMPYSGADQGPFLERPTEVGAYKANGWGFCDMQSNVNEWCRDFYQEKLPGGVDPEVSFGGPTRVVRGGGWWSSGRDCRSARRWNAFPDHGTTFHTGFRVAAVQIAGKGIGSPVNP